MPKLEKKLLEWVDRHLYILVLVFISLLALYLRRIPIWWNPENISAYFDCHENCTQSYFYYFLVHAVQYLPLLPIHSIKWLSVFGDFGTAALCLLLTRSGQKTNVQKNNILLPSLCYIACIFSPVLILRGCAWAQIDSLAVMFFLLGWLAWEKEWNLLAALSVLVSTLLYPCMLIFVFYFLWKEKKEESRNNIRKGHNWIRALIFFAVWLLCCGLTALISGKDFGSGVVNGFAWLSYDPITGELFATWLEWITGMLVNLGLAGSVTGGIMFVRRRRPSLFFILGTHFLIAALLGSRLFGGITI